MHMLTLLRCLSCADWQRAVVVMCRLAAGCGMGKHNQALYMPKVYQQ